MSLIIPMVKSPMLATCDVAGRVKRAVFFDILRFSVAP
jgi:hypothetical protein